MLRTYSVALADSFKIKGRRKPRVKKRKKTFPSLEYTTRGFSIQDRRLRLPHGVSIPVVWSRPLPSEPTSVRVFQDSLGHWNASFVVCRESAEPLPEVGGGVGIDWGVSTTATASDPAYDLPFGGHRRRCQAELAKAQRKMARRRRPKGQKASGGYAEAKHQAARLLKKAGRQNTAAVRVWAARVVTGHDVIGVEDFQPNFLSKSRNMARKAADAAIGATKRELIQRGKRAGRKVVMVPPAYTTMTCSECFARAKRRLELGERTFRCGVCGYTAERDRNAARLVLALARRILDTEELSRAGADGVRHFPGPPFEGVAVVLPEPEIPQLAVGNS
jgi:putative transposase